MKVELKNHKIVTRSKGYTSHLTGGPDIMHFLLSAMALIGLSPEPKCSIKQSPQLAFQTEETWNRVREGALQHVTRSSK